jgi:hypothetical protein
MGRNGRFVLPIERFSDFLKYQNHKSAKTHKFSKLNFKLLRDAKDGGRNLALPVAGAHSIAHFHKIPKENLF